MPFHKLHGNAGFDTCVNTAKNELDLPTSLDEHNKAAERFQLVVEAAPNAMIMVDADGLITLVNRQTEKLFGYDRWELLGEPIEMLVPERFGGYHRDHRSGFLGAPTARAMGAGRELFGRCKDGGEVPIEIGLNPIAAADGVFVLASIIDITHRKRAEEIFQLVVEAAPNAMIMVAADGLIALVNTQTEKLFGYDRRELLGQPIEILVPERFRANHSGLRRGFFLAPTRAKGEGRELFGLRKDGDEVPVEIGLNPIATSDGLFVLASIVDVTQRKKRTTELKQSLAEKTTLLKEVHHRVKNNLQVVCSLLSMQIAHSSGNLCSGPLNEAHSRILAMSLIHEQIYQSETLADLNFGQYVELLSCRLFAAYCVNPSRIRLDLRVEAIQLMLDHAIPCGLILNELLSNSLKHAFNDGREGVIRVSFRKAGGDRVELEVADNGTGLPAGFHLEDNASLGLQVVRALVGQLRADLVVNGENGTTFRFAWHLGSELDDAATAKLAELPVKA